MVTGAQVRRLMKLMQTEDTLVLAAAKAGMDEKTAGKYRQAGKLPSQLQTEHTWRTRSDPFDEVWPDGGGPHPLDSWAARLRWTP